MSINGECGLRWAAQATTKFPLEQKHLYSSTASVINVQSAPVHMGSDLFAVAAIGSFKSYTLNIQLMLGPLYSTETNNTPDHAIKGPCE